VYNEQFLVKSGMTSVGLTHVLPLGKRSTFRAIIATSQEQSTDRTDTLNPAAEYQTESLFRSTNSNRALRATMVYQQKISPAFSFSTGLIANRIGYDYKQEGRDEVTKAWEKVLDGRGNSSYYQGYWQGRWRAGQGLVVIAGVHSTYLALNEKATIEPRASIAYERRRQRYSLAAGIYSKPEHISTFLYKKNNTGQAGGSLNKGLDITKAAHVVGGWGTSLGKWRFKTEAYYQYLYDVPVDADSSTGFSMLNAEDVFSLADAKSRLVSKGTGRNVGA
jgi:hypothetical protein